MTSKNIAIEKITELKNLFTELEMLDFSDEIEEVINNRIEYIDYLQNLQRDAEVARDSFFKAFGSKNDDFLKYKHMVENLIKILEILLDIS